MGKVKIKLLKDGVHELLNSEWAERCVTEVGYQVVGRAGDGYAVAEPHHTGQRCAVNVYAASKEAKRDDNNTLLRALG